MASDKPTDQPLGDDSGLVGSQRFFHYAWQLSGRIVTVIGQLLLLILGAVGWLLRPVTARVTERLYGPAGRSGGSGGPTAGRGRDGRTRVENAPTAPLPRWIDGLRGLAAAWFFAPLTGLALTVAALAELASDGFSPASVPGGFAVAATLPLVWRRDLLRPVAAVVLASFAASLLSNQPLLVTTAFAALYTLYLLAQHLPTPSAGMLAVASVACLLVVYLASNGLADIPWPAAVAAVLGAIGLGASRRVVETAERTNAAAREHATQTLSRLDAVRREQAVLRERARIARELHDVVAHSVSMIAVQAETAPYTMRNLSTEAAQGYAEIARAAREALVEMRRLLGVLRADGRGEAEMTPQPRLDRLSDLIQQHRGAGGRVEMHVQGDRRDLSATLELSAYRIVQEALTNARRHAPGAQVRVELTYLPDRLAVRVTNERAAERYPAPGQGWHAGAPGLGAGPGAGPGAGSASATAQDAGHGLLGMRERATMLGGRFSAGPVTAGGFAVTAELPVVAREESPRS